MNTKKIISDIKVACSALMEEKQSLLVRIKEIDDSITAYHMAVESLELTIPLERKPEEHNPAPVKKLMGKEAKLIEYLGEKKSIPELAKQYGVNVKTLRYRLKHGWTIGDAVKADNKYNKRGKNKPKKVFAYDRHGNIVRQFIGIGDASRHLKMEESTVRKIIENMSKDDQLRVRDYYLAYVA